MRFKTILGIGCVSALLAAPAMAGIFTITNPGPADSFSFDVTILNDDGFDLTKVTFDLSTTTSFASGSPPLVFGGSGSTSGPPGGTATPFGASGASTFGFEFAGFNTGESFSFSWDPDIATDSGYGAVVEEAIGMGVTLVTTGGTVSGFMEYVGGPEDGSLTATINSRGAMAGSPSPPRSRCSASVSPVWASRAAGSSPEVPSQPVPARATGWAQRGLRPEPREPDRLTGFLFS